MDGRTHSNSVHSSQCRDRRGASKNKHRRDDDVRGQTEEHEDQVGDGAPACCNDLEPCVGVRGVELELRCELHARAYTQLLAPRCRNKRDAPGQKVEPAPSRPHRTTTDPKYHPYTPPRSIVTAVNRRIKR